MYSSIQLSGKLGSVEDRSSTHGWECGGVEASDARSYLRLLNGRLLRGSWHPFGSITSRDWTWIGDWRLLDAAPSGELHLIYRRRYGSID